GPCSIVSRPPARKARPLVKKQAAALSASARRGSSPLDAAQKAARPRGVDIDKVGARVAQTPLDQRIDVPPVADIAEIVEAEIVSVVGADRDQPIAHDLGNRIGVLEPAADFGMNPDWARGPVDPAWATEMGGAEQ